MKLLILLILLCPLTTCYSSNVEFFKLENGKDRIFTKLPIKWKFDCDFPEELKQPVGNAIEYWETLAKKKIFVKDFNCGISDVFIMNGDGGLVFKLENINKKENNTELWAIAPFATLDKKPFAGLIVFYKAWYDIFDIDIQETVARHEVGHFLGLAHNKNKNCIMNSYINRHDTGILKAACSEEIFEFQKRY